MATANPYVFTVGTTQYDFRNVLTALPYSDDPSYVVVTFKNGQGPLNLLAAQFNALYLAALNASGSSPTGSAGGDLTGTYPNPTVATVQGTTPTATGLSILGAANAAAGRTILGLSTAVTTANIIADGTTDQYAILAALLVAGGLVLLPQGVIRIVAPSSGIILNVAGGTRVESIGKTTLQIETSFSVFTAIQQLGTDVTFTDISFDVRPAANAVGQIVAWEYDDLVFRRCVFNGNTTTVGTKGSGTRSLTCQGITFSSVNNCAGLTLDNCTLTGLSFGFLKINTNTMSHTRINIISPVCHDNYREDLPFNSPQGPMSDIRISNATIYNMRGWEAGFTQLGISFASARDWSIIGANIIAYGKNSQGVHIEENSELFSVDGVNVESWGGDGLQVLSNNAGGPISVPHGGSITIHAKRMDNNVAAYNSGTTYHDGDLVSSGGINYRCVATTTGNAPPNTTYWYAFSTTGYGCYLVFDSTNQCVNRLTVNGCTFSSFPIGFQSGATQGIVSPPYNSEFVAVHDCISQDCGTGFVFFENGVGAHDNTSKSCTIGLQASRAQIASHCFQDCPTPWSATSRPMVLNEARFEWVKQDLIGAGEHTFAIAPLDTFDRVNCEANLRIQDAGGLGIYWERSSRYVFDGTNSVDAELCSNVSGTWTNPNIRAGSTNQEVVITTAGDVPSTCVSLSLRGLIIKGVL